MILHELYNLYGRLEADPDMNESLPRQGFSLQKISFFVVLTPDGTLYDIQDAKLQKTIPAKGRNAKDKVVSVARELIVPGSAHPSGSAPTPRFLWDTSAYIFGLYPDGANKKEKEKDKARDVLFPAYRQYHREFLERNGIDDPGLKAVAAFLESWNPSEIPDSISEKINKFCDNFGVFKVQNEADCVHGSAEILSAWKKRGGKLGLPTGMCLVTGETDVPIVPTLETKIKLGTAVGGAVLTSFNDPAYESYGKTQTFNAPISEEAGFKACNALNALLNDKRHHFKLGNTTVAFWTGKKTGTEDLLALALNATDADCSAMDAALVGKIKTFWQIVAKTGSPDLADLGDDEKTPFFMLGIEPNAARIVVRFWLESTLGDLVLRLREHQSAMVIQKTFDLDSDHIPLRMILAETVRKPRPGAAPVTPPPLLGAAVLRAVLNGLPYPESLYQLVLSRISVSHDQYKVGRKVSYVQASVVKAFLTRNKNKGGLDMSLNLENKHPAYLLGRLFATLEKTQDDASGGVNAGIGDKFYSSASARPRIVFPTLLDLFRKLLKKLSSANPGLAIVRDRLVGEILDDFDSEQGFPSNLSLEDRGFFAIGYYQQMRAFFTKKSDSDIQ